MRYPTSAVNFTNTKISLKNFLSKNQITAYTHKLVFAEKLSKDFLFLVLVFVY